MLHFAHIKKFLPVLYFYTHFEREKKRERKRERERSEIEREIISENNPEYKYPG